MNNNTISDERLSFYKLFKEKKYKISIPIIQRDYAQGRENKREIRDMFLDALDIYLREKIPNRDLDFVYGSLVQDDGITEFIPLDGQQRLTTLFLLHWYFYQTSNNAEKKKEYKEALTTNNKSAFTYKTRSSSGEFCDALMNNTVDFKKLLVSDEDTEDNEKGTGLSKTIKNSSWFYLSWELDPTIQSMLVMLDAIHLKFSDNTEKEEYFNRLLDTEKPIITFLILNLKDFNLTDDLYIKMNSRGKALTDFENFKAKFEQYMEKKIKTDRKFLLNTDNKDKEVSLKEYFSYNIDTKWSYLFWNYRSEDDNTFDQELANFIRIIFTNQYAVTVKIENEKTDKSFEYLLRSKVKNITYNKYTELGIFNEKRILFLIDVFDCLVNGFEKIKNKLSGGFQFYYPEEESFQNILKYKNISYYDRVMFHAYVLFLVENKDTTNIDQWIRVVHNLVENTIINTNVIFARAIKSVEKMFSLVYSKKEESKDKSKDILQELCDNMEIDTFSGWLVKEEKIKAHLILHDNKWKKAIESAEKQACFSGQIGFILEFAGLTDYFTKNKKINWTDEEQVRYFLSFENYAQKAIAVFSKYITHYKGSTCDKEYTFLWERAVLTKGDYLIEASSSRYNFLAYTSSPTNAERDFSWKRFLRITEDKNDDDEDSRIKRNYVKKVFDDKRFDISNIEKIEKSLEAICRDRTNEKWRDLFIGYYKLISFCEKGFVRFEDEDNIILLCQSQMNHYHGELYTLYLWIKYIEEKENEFGAFNEIYYEWSKSSEEQSHIGFYEFCYHKINYEAQIYYDVDNKSKGYIITFRKSKGKSPEEYSQEIRDILNKNNLKWDKDDGSFLITCKDEHETMEKIKKIDKLLQKLNTSTG